MKSALFRLQNNSFLRNPILVIDRAGLVGEPLCLKLSREFLVVFAGRKNSALDHENKNIVYVPFAGRFPVIPDNKYSHIIFIDEEGKDLEILPKIIDKAKNDNADFIFAQGLFPKNENVLNKVLKLCPGAKAVLFGDIFDSKIIFKKGAFRSEINKFIYQAQKFGKIQVFGDGLKAAYPVILDDVVDGLIDIVFKMHRAHSLFYIFPKHPPTELSLAHMIQKINPEVMVDFIRNDPRPESVTYPPNGVNLLGDKYPIAKKIRGIDIKKKIKTEEDSHERVRKFKFLPFFISWVSIFLLLSPFIFTILFSFLGNNTLRYAKKNIDRGNFANAKSSAHLTQAFFYAGKQTSNALSFQAKIAGLEGSSEKILEDIDLGYKISEGLSQAFTSGVYFSAVLNGESEDPILDFAKAEKYLKSSIVLLDKIRAEKKVSASILQSLETVGPLVKLLSATESIMPGILGMEGERTYLILFQDANELRPGGGIIDFYGILKFNMGRMTEFSIHDVDDADRQLRGHAEPPFALRRYLPEQHWYMRDSNFDMDFVKSASSSSNFLFAETGQKADGVIAVDMSLAKDIRRAIWPSESILSNLTQKRDFPKVFKDSIAVKPAGGKVSYFLAAQIISDALSQKRLMLALNNDAQKIFTVNGWSSALWDERTEKEDSVNDFVGINEANLGDNRISNLIRRQISHGVTIGDSGTISDELVINYKNESKAKADDYKNYLRVILPENTRLSEILVNDVPQDIKDAVTDPQVYENKNFNAPKGIEVEKASEGGKEIFGFLVKVPVGEIVKIKIKYTLPGNVAELDSFFYNLKLFKQPGVGGIPYSFSLAYPNSFNIVKNSDKITGGEGVISYSEKITEDKNLIVDFAKK